jgi:hypothetical protein
MADEGQIIDVPGLGEVTFPAGMDDKAIAAAIEDHFKSPGKFARKDIGTAVPTNAPRRDRLQDAMPDWMGSIYGHLKDPGWTTHVAKGIPIAGNYVEDTPNSKALEENHPWVAKGLEIGGNAASMVAPAGAVSKGAAAIAPGRTLEAILQTILGGGTAAANTATKEGSTSDDVKTSALLGGAGGAMSPVIGKIFSPTMDKARYTPEHLSKYSYAELEKMFGKGARDETKKMIKDKISDSSLMSVGGGVLSYLMGGGPLAGAAGGYVGSKFSEPISNILAHLVSNRTFHNKGGQAILNAAGETTGAQLAP